MHNFAAGSFVALSALFISGCGGQENTCLDDGAKQYPVVNNRTSFVKNDGWIRSFRFTSVSTCFEGVINQVCPELIIEDDDRLARLCEFSTFKEGENDFLEPQTKWWQLCSMVGKIDWGKKSMIVIYASSKDYYAPPFVPIHASLGGKMLTYMTQIVEESDVIRLDYVIQYTQPGGFLVLMISDPAGSMQAILIDKPCKPIVFNKTVVPPVVPL